MASHPARKPVHQAAPGRPEIWTALRKLRAATGETIRATAKAQWRTVEDYLLSLVAAGIVAVETVDGSRRNHVFRLVKDSGVEAPRVRRDGSLVPVPQTDALWRAMKMIGSFTALDLAAATGAAELQCRDYCQHLARAGYLQAQYEHPKPSRYRLIPAKNTGPLPPQIQRTKAVYDPNLRQIVWADADAAASRFDRGAE